MNILLIRPPFPDSRNNKYNSIPLGLLKISTHKKSIGDNVFYANGLLLNDSVDLNIIDEIYVTGMFTYWSQIVIDTATYWSQRCPNAALFLGGIYPTLMPEHVKEHVPNCEVIIGEHPNATDLTVPDYSLLPTNNEEINNTQIIRTMSGCFRKCEWCGVWKIEPKIRFYDVNTIENILIQHPSRKDVLIYDNNFLSNKYIDEYLSMFNRLHRKHHFKYHITQGIDGRLLTQDIADKMKRTGFNQLRFSWDHEEQTQSVQNCVNMFTQAGYKPKEMQIFCIINNIESPETIEDRYWKIYKMGAQIHSDRYRPLNQVYDNYDGSKINQTSEDYFINHEHGWTDSINKGMLKLMSQINYVNRHGFLFVEHDFYQNKNINKGKSSQKLSEYI